MRRNGQKVDEIDYLVSSSSAAEEMIILLHMYVVPLIQGGSVPKKIFPVRPEISLLADG